MIDGKTSIWTSNDAIDHSLKGWWHDWPLSERVVTRLPTHWKGDGWFFTLNERVTKRVYKRSSLQRTLHSSNELQFESPSTSHLHSRLRFRDGILVRASHTQRTSNTLLQSTLIGVTKFEKRQPSQGDSRSFFIEKYTSCRWRICQANGAWRFWYH